jgi:hypothetical protein
MTAERSFAARGANALVALVVPVAVVAVAYVLWWISDRLVIVGPLDRAQFGWLIVIPLFAAAPVVGAFLWAGLDSRSTITVAVGAACVVGVAGAWLFWRSVADPGCGTGNRFTPDYWIVPSLILGALFGASLGVSGMVGARFVRAGRPLVAVAAAVGTELLLWFVMLVFITPFLVSGACERPGAIG